MVDDDDTRTDAMTDHSTATTGNDRPFADRTTPEAQAEGSPYHILAASSPADELTRVLKHSDTFAVFDH
jgi:hypothetical protein